MKMLRLAFRLLLALTFAFAAVLKIRDPQSFFDAIQTYRILEQFPAAVVAIWLPWLELVLAGALWFGGFKRISSALLALLCCVFLVALAQAWIRGIDITCGCFAEPDQVHGSDYLLYFARDLGLLAAAVVLWRMDARAAPEKSGAAINPD